eukprot:5536024-Prymnesium_polylepis.1
MGMHTQRAGAAIGWISHISLARVRVGPAQQSMCQHRHAASSRTFVWRRTPAVCAMRALESKPKASRRRDAGHEASTWVARCAAASYLAGSLVAWGAPAARWSRAIKASPWATSHVLGLNASFHYYRHIRPRRLISR